MRNFVHKIVALWLRLRRALAAARRAFAVAWVDAPIVDPFVVKSGVTGEVLYAGASGVEARKTVERAGVPVTFWQQGKQRKVRQ